MHGPAGFRFVVPTRRQRVLFAAARLLPCVNHRPAVDAAIGVLGAAAGGLATLAGARPEIAAPAGILAAFLIATICNAVHRAAWNFPTAPPPPAGPGDPSGDFEPRRPLVPAGAGAAALSEPRAPERVSVRARRLRGFS